MALPFHPGNSFTDPTKTRFHVSQTLSYKNGFIQSNRPKYAVGGEPLQYNQLEESELDELLNSRPTLTYGNATKPAPVEFIPAHVAFDKKVLMLNAYFKQTVHESPAEHYRVRDVKIYYYLEDDSMSVVEPVVQNSGIPQGLLIKRQRLPKNDLGDFWHWKDLNVGMNITMYGKVFHTYDCDKFTADYLQSEGIDLKGCESKVPDPYSLTRHFPQYAYTTPSTYDKLRQFLEMDRKVLRFYCVWDDRDNLFGEINPYIIHYFLADDTVEIREVHEPNDGRDPFPVLVCRHKLAKNTKNVPTNFPTTVLELSSDEIKEWYSPTDFAIGKTINILGKNFFIYDCDEFTKSFYKLNFGMQDFEPYDVRQRVPKLPQQGLPPYNGFGSLDDSKQSCLSLIPQPPKKDVMKMLENDGKILRYFAYMESPRPEDKGRRFIITYRLCDDSITIYELQIRNSGVIGGKFLECTRVRKPGGGTEDDPVFYTPQDFAIGAVIEVFRHRFVITDTDRYVLKYMEARPEEFSAETIHALKGHHDART